MGIPNELIHDFQSRDILPDNASWSRLTPPLTNSSELVEWKKTLDLILKLVETLKSDRAIFEKNLAKLVFARKDALQRRCQILMESNIANEVNCD